MVAFLSDHGAPSLRPEGKGPCDDNWSRRLRARVRGLMPRRVRDRKCRLLSDGGRLSEVCLRSVVGGPTQLVVESPGYRQVLCEATPAIQDLFEATLRGECPGTLDAFATRIRALHLAADGGSKRQAAPTR
jgi:hypothetical protein